MSFESVTDSRIAELRAMPKHVTNPRARKVTKNNFKFEQVNYLAVNQEAAQQPDQATARFNIYWRLNLKDDEDFSCGIAWISQDGATLTLARYNGANHVHPPANLECHIHRASERAIREGRDPEFYAEVTQRYRTINGALHCLLSDFSVSGLSTSPDEPDLFSTT